MITDDDARREIIGELLGKKTWSGEELRATLTVEQIAERMAPFVCSLINDEDPK